MGYEIDDTDNEDMDDIALSEHIECNHDQTEEFSMDALDIVYGYLLLQNEISRFTKSSDR